MARLLLCAGIISLLAACSSMSGNSDSSMMGAPGSGGSYYPVGGPRGASGTL